MKLKSLYFPTSTEPKSRLSGVRLHLGGWVPVPVHLTSEHEPVPVSIAHILAPGELGENLTVTMRDSPSPKLNHRLKQ
jgi:hypothetical protein